MTELLKIAEVAPLHLIPGDRHAITGPSQCIKHLVSTNLGSPRDDHLAATDTGIATIRVGGAGIFTTYLQDTCREYPPIITITTPPADNHRSSLLSTTARPIPTVQLRRSRPAIANAAPLHDANQFMLARSRTPVPAS